MSRAVPSISRIVRGNGPLPPRKIKQIKNWLAADWEALDLDRDAVRLIRRLVSTVEHLEIVRGR